MNSPPVIRSLNNPDNSRQIFALGIYFSEDIFALPLKKGLVNRMTFLTRGDRKVKHIQFDQIIEEMSARGEDIRHEPLMHDRHFHNNRHILNFTKGHRHTQRGRGRSPTAWADKHDSGIFGKVPQTRQFADQPGESVLHALTSEPRQ